MAEKIATREAYGKALAALADKYPDLVCFDADLAGATMTKFFKAACPERFFDMGIAEADMVGVAAGMSLCGFKPFVNTFAMFAAGRAWEQVRNSVAYPHLNVKVVGSHGGLSVGEDGATHQCIEDFAIMRAIPGMLVLCPCDGNEMRLAVEALVGYEGPAYMRLGRLAVETVTDSIPGYKFELGKGATLRDGTDVTIIAVGMNVQMALAAAEKLAAEGISARVIDMHTIKPLDTELVLKAAKETGAIVTTEEANVLGGLGAAVAEYLGETYPIPVVRHGVNDEFGRSGKAPLVLDAYGINADGIAAKAKQAIAMNQIAEPYIRSKAIRHLEKGRVVIFGCGTGNPFFSTDTGAVLRAAEIGADAILLAKNIDGVYSADPAKDPTAVKYDAITYDEVLARHLAVMDTTATSLSMDNHIPVQVFALKDPQNILRVVMGEPIGTIVKEEL